MSNKGSPYDNAMAENFFSILKTERSCRHKPKTFNEAIDLIGRYIHFYNCERIQLILNRSYIGAFCSVRTIWANSTRKGVL